MRQRRGILKQDICGGRFLRSSAVLLAASAACFGVAHSGVAQGATETWTAGNGNWDTAANWNSGAGHVPAAGDTAEITDDDNTTRNVNYNYTGSAITLGSLTVDNDGAAGVNTLSMTGSGMELAADNEYLGDSGTSNEPGWGELVQSLGANSVSNALYLGNGTDDRGIYTLSGTGTLTTSDNQYIGFNGTGIFTQSGGTNKAEGGFALGEETGGSGTYTLSGGSLLATGTEYVGYGGAGVFDQTSGANTTSFALFIGMATGSSGTYTLGGGSLSVNDNETIGSGGATGSFIQTGGVNTASSFVDIESGGYSLSGGSLNVTDYVFVGDVDNGVFSLSGTGVLSVGTDEIVGFHDTSATFTQTGATTNTVPGSLEIGYVGSTAAKYDLSGGSLSDTGTELVGDSGSGTFNQTGGANSTATLEIGESSVGSYSLTAGTLSTTAAEVIGDAAAGSFNQTGGTNTPGGDLLIGDETGGSGTYTLSGGSLSVGDDENVGYAGTSALLDQSGLSTNTVGNNLNIGYTNAVTGEYVISGTGSILTVNGSVFVSGNPSAAGGASGLEIDAGQVTIEGTLKVWNVAGTEVFIAGGNTTVGNTVNLSFFDQAGGTSALGAVSGTGNIFVGTSSGTSASMTVTALTQNSVTVESTGTLTMEGGAPSNTLNQLTINGVGIFNITNGHLFIDYGASADPISTIRSYLVFGYNGGAWNGPGIDSTVAAANSLSYGIGYADSADPGNPANLASGTIEVKYTLLGDANLDGIVNGVDFGILAANFNKGVSRWDQGDFNYDNVVNGIDFGDLAANFNKGASGAEIGPAAIDDPAIVAFAQANGLIADVPEPGCIAVLTVALGTLCARRRRSTI